MESDTPWQTISGSIPINFKSVKGDSSNLLQSTYQHLDVTDGVYQTEEMKIEYLHNSTRLKVSLPDQSLVGAYQWRVVAVDKAGSNQYTQSRPVFLMIGGTHESDETLPLSVLHITGIGNPLLNSFSPSLAKSRYTTTYLNPIFYGIAWSGSQVKLSLIPNNCTSNDCTINYTTTANDQSRFGINLDPTNLQPGDYQVIISNTHQDRYTQLPVFTVRLGRWRV